MATKKVLDIDPLGYVRERLQGTTAIECTRIAADTGVTPRTVENLRDGKHEPFYNTVMKVYALLRAREQGGQAERRRKA